MTMGGLQAHDHSGPTARRGRRDGNLYNQIINLAG